MSAGAAADQRVEWNTADGVHMVGRFLPPTRNPALTWVLLHGLGSVKGEWNVFAEALAAQGDGVLIYDARGHGESIVRAGGGSVDYRSWSRDDDNWKKMSADLGSAVNMLRKQFSLDPHHVAVGGASLGANVALVYASQHADAPALLLLSPGLEYAGVETPGAFRAYGTRPMFMAASPGDPYAYATVGELARTRGDGACTVAQGPGSAHGVAMFSPEFTKRVLLWIKSLEK